MYTVFPYRGALVSIHKTLQRRKRALAGPCMPSAERRGTQAPGHLSEGGTLGSSYTLCPARAVALFVGNGGLERWVPCSLTRDGFSGLSCLPCLSGGFFCGHPSTRHWKHVQEEVSPAPAAASSLSAAWPGQSGALHLFLTGLSGPSAGLRMQRMRQLMHTFPHHLPTTLQPTQHTPRAFCSQRRG